MQKTPNINITNDEKKINYFSIKTNQETEKERKNKLKTKRSNIDMSRTFFLLVAGISLLCIPLFYLHTKTTKSYLAVESSLHNHFLLTNQQRILNTSNIATIIKDIEKQDESQKPILIMLAASIISKNATSPYSSTLDGNIFLHKNGILLDDTENMKLISGFNKFNNPEKLSALNKINEKNLKELIEAYKKTEIYKENSWVEGKSTGLFASIIPNHTKQVLSLNNKTLENLYRADNDIKYNLEIYNILTTKDKSEQTFSISDYLSDSDRYWNENYREKFGENPEFLKIHFNQKTPTDEELKDLLERY